MQKKVQINKNNIDIPVNFYQEGDLVVAQSPALEIATQGDTFEEAKKNFEELVEIFFEEFDTKEKLDAVLQACGWQTNLVNNIEMIQPPKEIARIYQPISIPFYSDRQVEYA